MTPELETKLTELVDELIGLIRALRRTAEADAPPDNKPPGR